jgi:hypothetical protein
MMPPARPPAADYLQSTFCCFTALANLCLDIGPVSVAMVAIQNALIVGFDLVAVLFDVVDGSLHIP